MAFPLKLGIYAILLVGILPKNATGFVYPHPLDPLSSAEIRETVTIIRTSTPLLLGDKNTWIFNWITLKEPEKKLLLPFYLNKPTSTLDLRQIPRRSLTILEEKRHNILVEVVVNLSARKVESWKEVAPGTQATYSWDEGVVCVTIAKEDPRVQERCAEMGWTNLSLVVGRSWGLGYTKDQPVLAAAIRPIQVWMWGQSFERDNQNAHPFDFTVTVDLAIGKVILIENLPTHSDYNAENRQGNVCPKKNSNYDPSLLPPNFLRKDVHPIQFSQPEGAGYTIRGNEVSWQKFKFRVGFNTREGLLIHQVTYKDGDNVRPLFYRMSVAEFFVPYGDPRPPYHQKMAFDEGEFTLGMVGVDLKKSGMCLGGGVVSYFTFPINVDNGDPLALPNVICIHEEDTGLLWAHLTNEGKVLHTRSQRLTVSIFVNEGNYDYKFSWKFYQDATIEFTTELHGALSTNLMAVNATPGGFGSVVSPGLNAQYHQHFMAVRLDTEIDGNQNTVSMVDVAALADPTGSPKNPYGNGFTTRETILQTAGSARTQISPLTGRTWLMKNTGNIHPYTGKPVSWKLMPFNAPHVFLRKDSPIHPRCAFTDYNIWVTRYEEDQLYPAGFYKDGTGLPQWVQEDPNADVTDTDVVLWYIYGFTHIPRVEDFPIMPMESSGFVLKPTNFFLENPSVDVPPPPQ